MTKKIIAFALCFIFLSGIFFALPKDASAHDDNNYTYRPHENYQYHYAEAQNYTYNSTDFGKSIQKTGQYSYAIVDKTTNFNNDQDVYVLAKISSIAGIDTFQIKFDVYANGNRFIKTNEVPTLWPRGQKWEYNHSWANLGRLSNGYYEIRTSISINGGSYVKLNSQTINVGSSCGYNGYDCNRDCGRKNTDCSRKNTDRKDCRRNRDCGRSCDYKPSYTFDWTRLNTAINKSGTNSYFMNDRNDVFYSDESIKALTRVSNINNIGFFQVKLDLYQNGSFKREYLAQVQKPDRNYWDVNYTQSDLGQLSEGDYIVKTYISVDGSTFQLAGSKNFTVRIWRNNSGDCYHGEYRDCNNANRQNYDNRGCYDCSYNGNVRYSDQRSYSENSRYRSCGR